MGDFLIITNIIKAIKDKYKDSHITLVGSPYNKKIINSYKIIDNFEVCINPMSTFGYEALAREKKVSFFSGDFIKGSDFRWPLNSAKKGKFYTNSNSINEVERILNYLINVNEESWLQEINKYKDKIFYHDEDNKIIKSFLTENNITKKWQ